MMFSFVQSFLQKHPAHSRKRGISGLTSDKTVVSDTAPKGFGKRYRNNRNGGEAADLRRRKHNLRVSISKEAAWIQLLRV